MSEMARRPQTALHTARDLAAQCRLPLPTVSKVLKVLLHEGVLISQRGVKGGYSLAREVHAISLAEIISAIEGPLALTECSLDVSGLCDLESSCQIKDNQRIINEVVRGALRNVMLSDLIRPMQPAAVRDQRGALIPISSLTSGRMQ